ncbi:uncharacterized protein DUF4450 [Sphingobacterium allocomposti]|uniref:Uncharacterized protein DUF4450 n=1 Tax=Sphingobacterium allocomposti TaxID=415956 RepID=A0A5S5DUX6_9SPHI|nr:DUF4450 domain-containing protein [Sphingobacterium composti Yoo et al. 2007 non Ten et al. 2007]TYP98419.1 uncharacterized protein DUF4450 [Sphingobacterium composti Yoo et al. 2007 non Ten et al. 2007]
MWRILLCSFSLLATCLCELVAQSRHWQQQKRSLHYTEDNGDFLLVNGKYRFNRALYGDNRASRVEAGDLPEFALYLPGMGGNLQFVIRRGNQYKKLIDAAKIETRYRVGSMRYTISDPLLGKGSLLITVLAQHGAEGMVLKIEGQQISGDSQLYAIYGGASGKTFSRNGDIGADPESGFYLLPTYAAHNQFVVSGKAFALRYRGKREEEQHVHGAFSGNAKLHITDATVLERLHDIERVQGAQAPVLAAKYERIDGPIYIQVSKGKPGAGLSDENLKLLFEGAESKRQSLADRIRLRTPDRFINNFGPALAVAADAIWESPTFLHGAVAWRMRLNAWRGAYAADVLGWHDRAKEHFSSYVNSQVISPAEGPVVMDTALHLARHAETMGTAVFTSGYISRNPNNNTVPHHYDMNLVFFDQLLSHFNYTGDLEYAREMWPAIVRHLAWEKRNFDRDDDGLYDAYCAIWASDGLQYAGGAVTHTSAYNYRANRAAAKLATLIGENPKPYNDEANKIERALRERLWLPHKGHFAEFQDLLGNRLLHEKPGVWTIYHAADACLLNDFEHYQNTQYVLNHTPKIPIRVDGQAEHNLYTLATTDWQPYTWSVNNVALAENLQTALAFWQAGRNEDAFLLWKSNIVESMFNGISPGNFQQLSHYDAFRGELYRDFADPIGVAARTLAEGLFGVRPKLIDNVVEIRPGFPSSWDFAELDMPAWQYSYRKANGNIQFDIHTRYQRQVRLQMEVPVSSARISAVHVNGEPVSWTIKKSAIQRPVLVFETSPSVDFHVEILGEGQLPSVGGEKVIHPYTDTFSCPLPPDVAIGEVYDPQRLLAAHQEDRFVFIPGRRTGTFFIQLLTGGLSWWHPVNIELVEPVSHHFKSQGNRHVLQLKNNGDRAISLAVQGENFSRKLTLGGGEEADMEIPITSLSRGTNRFRLETGNAAWEVQHTAWEVQRAESYVTTDLSGHYNASLTDIFEQKYLAPRPEGPTLQLPWQGIGNWCYPLTTAVIDDMGLMNARKDDVVHYLDIPFLIKGQQRNVLYTSTWDNYPTKASIPLRGKARKIYLLMAGSTNPMQSQLINAKVLVTYSNGEADTLMLKNPVNWWPIEQDYLDDNYAFEIADDLIPYRIKLKTGELYRGGALKQYSEIKGFSTRAVDGGAATLVDLPLDGTKELSSLTVLAEANDVVVGLIAATLLRSSDNTN